MLLWSMRFCGRCDFIRYENSWSFSNAVWSGFHRNKMHTRTVIVLAAANDNSIQSTRWWLVNRMVNRGKKYEIRKWLTALKWQFPFRSVVRTLSRSYRAGVLSHVNHFLHELLWYTIFFLFRFVSSVSLCQTWLLWFGIHTYRRWQCGRAQFTWYGKCEAKKKSHKINFEFLIRALMLNVLRSSFGFQQSTRAQKQRVQMHIAK